MGAGSSQPTTITKENASEIPPYNVEFTFFDNIRTADDIWPDVQWEARLMVQAKDISNLMKEGFYVCPENELTKCGCIIPDANPKMFMKNDWVHLRRFLLQDSKARWTAHLFVSAQELSVLAGFRLRDLTTERIAYARAWNSEMLLVYYYNAYKIGESFNTAHEDLALAGLWPWPKLERSHGEKSTGKRASYHSGVDVETEELPIYTPATTDASDNEYQRNGTKHKRTFHSRKKSQLGR